MAKVLWTTREIAETAGRSRWTVMRAAGRLAGLLGPPRYRRRPEHPRRHRVYSVADAQLLFQALGASGAAPHNLVKENRR